MHKNEKKECEKFGERKIRPIFATHSGGKPDESSEEIWEFSSVGLEHLPYKQRVGGSTPSTPTRRSQEIVTVFFVSVLVLSCYENYSPPIFADNGLQQTPQSCDCGVC